MAATPDTATLSAILEMELPANKVLAYHLAGFGVKMTATVVRGVQAVRVIKVTEGQVTLMDALRRADDILVWLGFTTQEGQAVIWERDRTAELLAVEEAPIRAAQPPRLIAPRH